MICIVTASSLQLRGLYINTSVMYILLGMSGAVADWWTAWPILTEWPMLINWPTLADWHSLFYILRRLQPNFASSPSYS